MATCSDAVRQELKALYGVTRFRELDLAMGRNMDSNDLTRDWTDEELRAIFAKYDKLVEIPITLSGFDYNKYLEGTV